MFASLFSVKNLASAARKGSPRRARPEIDALEDRTVPSSLFAGAALQNDGAVGFPPRPGEEIPTATASSFVRGGDEMPTATTGSGLHSSRSKGEEIPSGGPSMGKELPMLSGGRGGIIGDCGLDVNANPFRNAGEETPSRASGEENPMLTGLVSPFRNAGEEIPSRASAGKEIPMLTGGQPSSGDSAFAAASAVVFADSGADAVDLYQSA